MIHALVMPKLVPLLDDTDYVCFFGDRLLLLVDDMVAAVGSVVVLVMMMIHIDDGSFYSMLVYGVSVLVCF